MQFDKGILLGMVLAIGCGGLMAQKKNTVSFSFNPSAGSGVWYNYLLFPASYNAGTEIEPQFSFGFQCEYQRSLTSSLFLGVGAEYHDLRFGASRSHHQNSPGLLVDSGKTSLGFNYHYLSIPVTLSYSFVHTPNINFYSYFGISPGLVLNIQQNTQYTDSSGVLITNETKSLMHQFPKPNLFSLEIRLGLGIRYYVTPSWSIYANAFYGFNCVSTTQNDAFLNTNLLTGYASEYTIRYGGNVGFGYSF